MTDAELMELSERLLLLDTNNGTPLEDVDYQGETSECSTQDRAPQP